MDVAEVTWRWNEAYDTEQNAYLRDTVLLSRLMKNTEYAAELGTRPQWYGAARRRAV